MTETEMREYLEGHFYASKKIKALQAEKNKLSSTTEISDIESEIISLRDKQRTIRELISSLHDDDLEAVLIFRYIVHNTEEQTAEKLNYAPRTVQEKIKKAVKKLCAKMCENVW